MRLAVSVPGMPVVTARHERWDLGKVQERQWGSTKEGDMGRNPMKSGPTANSLIRWMKALRAKSPSLPFFRPRRFFPKGVTSQLSSEHRSGVAQVRRMQEAISV